MTFVYGVVCLLIIMYNVYNVALLHRITIGGKLINKEELKGEFEKKREIEIIKGT